MPKLEGVRFETLDDTSVDNIVDVSQLSYDPRGDIRIGKAYALSFNFLGTHNEPISSTGFENGLPQVSSNTLIHCRGFDFATGLMSGRLQIPPPLTNRVGILLRVIPAVNESIVFRSLSGTSLTEQTIIENYCEFIYNGHVWFKT